MVMDRSKMRHFNVKTALKSTSLLVHFDSSLPLILSCDASPYGVGVVLSHKMSDNVEKV